MKTSIQRYSFKYFEPLIIITFWIILFTTPLLFGQFQDGIDWTHVVEVWKNNLPLLGLFFVHRFLLMPLFFFKDKKLAYFIVTLTIILVAASLIYNIGNRSGMHPPPPERMEMPFEGPPEEVLGGEFPPHTLPRQNYRGPIPAYANFIILAILIVGFDAGLQIAMRWSNLEQEKFKLQKENVENQLAFLKNQVSPHFFMNTLNNIHALVDIDAEEAKQSIIKLSSLMRHLLYDSEENLTPIKKEVEFIQSYIELMRLRFTEKVTIDVDIPDAIPEASIPPLLFTSLLENAFKHGISYNNESFIHISMSFPKNHLNFTIENSNHSKKAEASSGIGIENTRKRLDLLYKNEYELAISDTAEKYAVNLNIPL